MWPFKQLLSGLWHKPRYRLMKSYAYPTRYHLWDRKEKRATIYFNSLDEAILYIEVNNIDCDEIKAFK
jgi:hypothetical protein